MSSISLSREILFGTRASVAKLIKEGADVNEKDPYGLTPLIEATLKADMEIAKLLIHHGAKIDQEDITGQTALQWAVNRYQLPFCQLYLENKADANHYSADGQPLLVNPILREQNDLINLLKEYGADKTFTEDFINGKLMGHRFELNGRARLLTPKKTFVDLNYEGFYLEFTVGLIMQTLLNFMRSDVGISFSVYSTVLSKIARSLKRSAEIIPFKYTTEGPAQYDALIKKILSEDLVVIPVSYEGHAITFVKYGHLFAKCDRGVKHIVDTVIIYELGNPNALNPDFLKDLMFNNKSDEYINTDVKKILNLKPFVTLPPRYQLSGNCSWANVEASVPAMMFMLMFRGNPESRGEIAALKKSIMNYYDTWVEWDKDRVLDEWLQSFYQSDKERRIAKASVIAAILFQRSRVGHKREIERAKKS